MVQGLRETQEAEADPGRETCEMAQMSADGGQRLGCLDFGLLWRGPTAVASLLRRLTGSER